MKRRDFLILLALTAAGCGSNTDTVGQNLGSADPAPAERFNHGLGAQPATAEQLANTPKALDPSVFGGVNAKATLPTSFQLPAAITPPVQDQGQLESCGSFAIGYAATTILTAGKNLGLDVSQAANQSSAAYMYKSVYQLEGLTTCLQDQSGASSGTYACDYYNLLVKQGNATWASTPYPNPNGSERKMCSEFDALALPASALDTRFQLGSWAYIEKYKDLDTIKEHLSSGYPVSFLMQLFENLDDNFVDTTGTTVFEGQGAANQGGHFLCIIGYDDTLKAFLVQNSWGTGFGYQGRFWLAYTSYTKAVEEAHVANAVAAVTGGTTMSGGSGGGTQGRITRVHQALASDGRVHLVFHLDLSRPVEVEKITLSDGTTKLGWKHKFLFRQGYIYVSRKDGASFAEGQYTLTLELKDEEVFTLSQKIQVPALPGTPGAPLNADVTGSHGQTGETS